MWYANADVGWRTFSALLDMALKSQEAELAATPASVALRYIFIALVLWKDFQALLEFR